MIDKRSEKSETVISRMIHERGPIPKSKTPFENRHKEAVWKHEGVKLLNPSSSQLTRNNSFSTGSTQSHTVIVFHRDHDMKEVVRTWLDENPRILEKASSWAVYSSLCSRSNEYDIIQDALKTVLKRRDPDGWVNSENVEM